MKNTTPAAEILHEINLNNRYTLRALRNTFNADISAITNAARFFGPITARKARAAVGALDGGEVIVLFDGERSYRRPIAATADEYGRMRNAPKPWYENARDSNSQYLGIDWFVMLTTLEKTRKAPAAHGWILRANNHLERQIERPRPVETTRYKVERERTHSIEYRPIDGWGRTVTQDIGSEQIDKSGYLRAQIIGERKERARQMREDKGHAALLARDTDADIAETRAEVKRCAEIVSEAAVDAAADLDTFALDLAAKSLKWIATANRNLDSIAAGPADKTARTAAEWLADHECIRKNARHAADDCRPLPDVIALASALSADPDVPATAWAIDGDTLRVSRYGRAGEIDNLCLAFGVINTERKSEWTRDFTLSPSEKDALARMFPGAVRPGAIVK